MPREDIERTQRRIIQSARRIVIRSTWDTDNTPVPDWLKAEISTMSYLVGQLDRQLDRGR